MYKVITDISTAFYRTDVISYYCLKVLTAHYSFYNYGSYPYTNQSTYFFVFITHRLLVPYQQ